VLLRADHLSAVVAVVMRGKRRKHADSRALRVRKGLVSSPGVVRRGEIVEEITRRLKPWKSRTSETIVTSTINYELDWLLRAVPVQAKWQDRALQRKHAERLESAVTLVTKLLVSAPPELSDTLFPEVPLYEDGGPQEVSAPTQRTVRPEWRPWVNFYKNLQQLRERCNVITKTRPSSPPNSDRSKHLCAWVARGLMEMLSDKKITGTEGGAFRSIATLLYETISGIPNVDLKRACDSALPDEDDQ
jgi:hypothetical protein